MGAWHVDRYGSADALVRLRHAISRLNESFGNRNTATDGYHETITAALRPADREVPRGLSTRDEPAAEGGGTYRRPLGRERRLLRFYTGEALMSTRARAEWVEPDPGPIAV